MHACASGTATAASWEEDLRKIRRGLKLSLTKDGPVDLRDGEFSFCLCARENKQVFSSLFVSQEEKPAAPQTQECLSESRIKTPRVRAYLSSCAYNILIYMYAYDSCPCFLATVTVPRASSVAVPSLDARVAVVGVCPRQERFSKIFAGRMGFAHCSQ